MLPRKDTQVQITRDSNSRQSPQKDSRLTEQRSEWEATCLMPLAVTSEEGRWRTSQVPYLTFLPELLSSHWSKNVGKESGLGKGASLAGRAQIILCWSLNQVIPLHPPQLLCPSPSTASYHHHPAKHYCSPPLIPRSRQGKKSCAPEAEAGRPVSTTSSL